MSEEVYRAIAMAPAGFVEAPAGCGKTEAIVRTVGNFCAGTQLVLTHTIAGVDVLRQRFREQSVPSAKYHVDTIAGWSWGWVRKYPGNGEYCGPLELAEWNGVYVAMSNLLQKDFVKQGVLNSYQGVIVDEYQDCTLAMHQLIVQLKRLLPCRILGDDLQGIFGFGDDPLIGWNDVRAEFGRDLGALETPHRWMKANNEAFGRWLLGTRPTFRENREPDYRGSRVDRRDVSHSDLARELVRLSYEKGGRICVIGPKARALPGAIETSLVNRDFRVLEPNELSALKKLITALVAESAHEKHGGALAFLERAFGGLSANDKSFAAKLLKNEPQRPQRDDRRKLCETHRTGTTPRLILALLNYVEQQAGVSCKLKASVSALRCVLENHLDTGSDLKELYANEVAKRKHESRSRVFRCVGSTLLVKGLEFDHAVIVRSADWQRSWGNHRDLYVALTRGSISATVIDIAA